MFSGYVKQARSYLTQIFLHFYIKVHIAILSVKSSLTLSIFAQKYLRIMQRYLAYLILQNKYLCIYEDSFGAKIVREDCAPKSSISIGINIHKLLLVIAIWTSKSREPGVLCLIIIFIPGIYSQVIAE